MKFTTATTLATAILVSSFAFRTSRFAFAQCAPDTLFHSLANPALLLDDQFGSSVAVSGSRGVVGVTMGDVPPYVNRGTAYVYDVLTGARLFTLANPDLTNIGRFGVAVAIEGNLAVVGNDLAGTGELFHSGAAYVYNTSTGALVAALVNPAPVMGDAFGFTVAISGNVAVVGNRSDGSGALYPGAAYVFNATTGALMHTLGSPEPTNGEQFGYSVAVSGDRVVVGAPQDSPGGVIEAGTAYVFSAATGGLTRTLSNPNSAVQAEGDFLGYAVAIDGDRIVVGAQAAGPQRSGEAYVFDAATGALGATLVSPEPLTGQTYASTVSISGNLALVGALADNIGGVFSVGRAHVYNATTGVLLSTLNNPDPTEGDFFAISVAISGSVAIVGADKDDPGGVIGSGSAYIFTCASLIPTPTPVPAGRDAGDFDGSGCTGIEDFLFLLDNWHTVSPIGGPEIAINDFLALLDNWHAGASC